MYQFSRGIYRELASDIVDIRLCDEDEHPHAAVLKACESAVERLALDRHYFARPARSLFNDIRIYFQLADQRKVWHVVERYIEFAEEWLSRQPRAGFDINGNPLQCRATTRKGTACQRVPLPHNGYCPSHQHLAETEEVVGVGAELEDELAVAA
jgi:hypothetical protein